MNNIDELNFRVYTQKSEADKAMNSIKGILLGFNLDGIIDQNEIQELHKWVTVHEKLIDHNPFKDFMILIKKTLTENYPTRELIEDLLWSCEKCGSKSIFYNTLTADLQVLQGLCHGILSDGEITDQEIHKLEGWLDKNDHLSTYFPYDELRSLVLTITSDGKIEEKERKLLEAFINQFVDLKNIQVKQKVKQDTSNMKISGLCTSEPNILFHDNSFCITGVLKRGSRVDTQNKIRQLGGIPVDNVTKSTNYLIVGDNGNPAWAFACYGRKVERALSLRREGCNIGLIHEYDFFDVLDDMI